ncbi:MAG TPA: ATP-binding protein [bacterium]|nr:ATP-binding protein [bacterium]
MGRRVLRMSIVARISIVFGLLVFCTALIINKGGEIRTERLYRAQREARMEFLASSISHGITNILISPGARKQVGRITEAALQQIMTIDPSVVGCEIKDRNEEVVYKYIRLSDVQMGKFPYSEKAVMSGDERIGSVRLFYEDLNLLEIEKTRQVIMLGGTIASTINYYIKKYDYFQVEFLAREIIEDDPDVLYSSITGAGGTKYYEYRIDEFSDYLSDQVAVKAGSVSTVQPVLIQEIGTSSKYGRMVEVDVLIDDAGKRLGIVRIGYSMASLVNSLQRERVIIGFYIFGVTLLAFGVAVFIARNITRPLAELTEIARSIDYENDGELSGVTELKAEIESLKEAFGAVGDRLVNRGDEVGKLSTAFRSMMQRLDARIHELETFYSKISVTDRFYAMGQLSAGIAHEINNPLAIISTYAQIILKRKDLDDELRNEVITILEEIDRIADKVKDLLSFAHDSQYEYKVSDINEVLLKTLDLTKHQFKKMEIDLVCDITRDDSLMVKVDANKIRQVFLNMILNAVQAMEGAGKKVLTVGSGINSEGNAEIIFSDTGIGIHREDLSRIFDPFFTTKEAGIGTGIGLAISYNIVSAHNGEIVVDSEPGKGTQFRIILPHAS